MCFARRSFVLRAASLFALVLAMVRVPACEYGDGQEPQNGGANRPTVVSLTPAPSAPSPHTPTLLYV